MNRARNLEPEERLRVAQLHIEMGDWVHSLAPWQVISHMTFSWEASIHSAQRCYEKFMRAEMWGVSYFYALEQNPGREAAAVAEFLTALRATEQSASASSSTSLRG